MCGEEMKLLLNFALSWVIIPLTSVGVREVKPLHGEGEAAGRYRPFFATRALS